MDQVPPSLPPGQPPYPPPPPPGPYPGYPYQMPPPQRGWMARNWPWFVPLGCLALPGLLVAVLVGGAFLLVGALKESDPYKESLARASADKQVVEALGTPIEGSFFVTGNINLSNLDGKADLHTTISGPKGEGNLTVVGTKSHGVWSYSTMRVHINRTDENIDLLGRER